MSTPRFIRRRVPALALAVPYLAFLALGASCLTGCGSGGHTVTITREQVPANFYYGKTYLAAGLTVGDLGGNLSMSVSQDGTARGTLFLSELATTRAQAHARTRQTEDTPSSGEPTEGEPTDVSTVYATAYDPYHITLTGSFDAATGKFAMTGTYIVGGDAVVPATVTGTLPAPPKTTGGAIITEINGTTYPSAVFTSVFDLGATT